MGDLHQLRAPVHHASRLRLLRRRTGSAQGRGVPRRRRPLAREHAHRRGEADRPHRGGQGPGARREQPGGDELPVPHRDIQGQQAHLLPLPLRGGVVRGREEVQGREVADHGVHLQRRRHGHPALLPRRMGLLPFQLEARVHRARRAHDGGHGELPDPRLHPRGVHRRRGGPRAPAGRQGDGLRRTLHLHARRGVHLRRRLLRQEGIPPLEDAASRRRRHQGPGRLVDARNLPRHLLPLRPASEMASRRPADRLQLRARGIAPGVRDGRGEESAGEASGAHPDAAQGGMESREMPARRGGLQDARFVDPGRGIPARRDAEGDRDRVLGRRGRVLRGEDARAAEAQGRRLPVRLDRGRAGVPLARRAARRGAALLREGRRR